jgi:hypothetical protein
LGERLKDSDYGEHADALAVIRMQSPNISPKKQNVRQLAFQSLVHENRQKLISELDEFTPLVKKHIHKEKLSEVGYLIGNDRGISDNF